jgi:spore maturation protein B
VTFQTISQVFSNSLILLLVAGIPTAAYFRGVKVYESFIDGAKGGIEVLIKIVPYLVAMLVAIGMFRASGAMDHISHFLSPILNYLGISSDLLPLALIRPFSGSAANGVMADIIHTHGGDSIVSKTAATMMGSTETTFYVIAIYFGAASIRSTRHAVPVGLLADAVGVIAAIWICKLMF